MKWPTQLVIVRHAESTYNELRARKAQDLLYQAFLQSYQRDYRSWDARQLAATMRKRYSLGVGDEKTVITAAGKKVAQHTGRHLMRTLGGAVPDVIIVSPYVRTCETLQCMTQGWPALGTVKTVPDDRIREQEHGLALLYNDYRVFHVMHPEQKELRDLLGPYWYQYPQGESVAQVRDRVRSLMGTLIREYAGQRVLMVTHHLTILSIRANLERLSPEQFIHLDEHEKPINCGVTIYEGNPTAGKQGRLVLRHYNQRLGKPRQ